MSAKHGTGVENLLPSIIKKVPRYFNFYSKPKKMSTAYMYLCHFLLSPPGGREGPLRMLLFDSWYDHYRGVICLVAVTDGSVEVG